jgi:uncharacterized protein (DUF1919 family)
LMPLGLLAREDDDLSTFVRESFEHPASFSESRNSWPRSSKTLEKP